MILCNNIHFLLRNKYSFHFVHLQFRLQSKWPIFFGTPLYIEFPSQFLGTEFLLSTLWSLYSGIECTAKLHRAILVAQRCNNIVRSLSGAHFLKSARPRRRPRRCSSSSSSGGRDSYLLTFSLLVLFTFSTLQCRAGTSIIARLRQRLRYAPARYRQTDNRLAY